MTYSTPPKQSKHLQEERSLNLDGELDMTDYVQAIPPSQQTVEELAERSKAQFDQMQEETRSSLALRLVTIFGSTLVVTYLFVGITAVTPSTDKELIKDITSQVIPPQVALLGAALGYYFGSKKS
jgi:hypothetical protein